VIEKEQKMMYNKEEKERKREKLKFKKSVAEKPSKPKGYKRKSKKCTNEILNDNIEELYVYDF